MGGGRLKADTELLGDLFGGQSVRDQFQHLYFARCQRLVASVHLTSITVNVTNERKSTVLAVCSQ